MATADTLELEVMAHRYLYYVLSEPQLPDLTYDVLEREARAVCPPESPVHGVGSSLPSSYTAAQVALAKRWLGE
jgi:NAD-dependent DNA ligase